MREKQLMECFTGMEHGNRVKLDSIQVSGKKGKKMVKEN